jgi:hypothetical protein
LKYLSLLLEYVDNNGIDVRKSFDNCLKGNIYQAVYEGNSSKWHIVLPMFTDDSELVQCYNIAHELGHCATTDNDKPFRIGYGDEKKAWAWAERLLVELGIPLNSGNDDFHTNKLRYLHSYIKTTLLYKALGAIRLLLTSFAQSLMIVVFFAFIFERGILMESQMLLSNQDLLAIFSMFLPMLFIFRLIERAIRRM